MTNQRRSEEYRSLAFWSLTGLTLLAAAFLVAPFFNAIMWATVLSVLLFPFYKRLRARFSENVSATFTVLFTLLVVIIPLSLIGLLLFVQLSDIASELKDNGQLTGDGIVGRIADSLQPLLDKLGAKFNIVQWYGENKDEIAQSLSRQTGQAVTSIISTLVMFVIALLTMFFMLRDGHRLERPVIELIPLPEDKARGVIAKMGATIHAVFITVVLVALAQGALSGIFYWITGVPNALIWTLATTVLCIIPLLGAPLIYIPLALMQFSEGLVWQPIVLLLGGFGIVSQIDNVLKPWLIGARVALHPMAVFFALLGGVLVWGPIGLMAGPLLLTVLLALQDIIRESCRENNTEKTQHPVETVSDAN